jgi:hypothetical protein
MLKLDNPTPWQAALYPDWRADLKPQTTLVVKLAYRFDTQGRTEALEPAPPIETADRHHEDNPAASLAAARESVPFKQGGEILCHGTAHPPGEAARVMEASLALSRDGSEFWRKTLRITGPRQWHKGLLATGLTDPDPLQPLPLRYEHAYGGRDPRDPERRYDFNPTGLGYSARSRWRGDLAVPQIEIGPDYLRTLSQRPTPAGFGPIAASWQPRLALAPEVDPAALAAGHCPYRQDLPLDLHNAAPLDQRFEQPFQGGELLQLGGLIAGAPADGISIELPPNRPEAWLIRGRAAPRPIQLLCDTLVVRTDEQEIHLLWRGAIEAAADATGHILIRPGAIPEPEQEDAA